MERSFTLSDISSDMMLKVLLKVPNIELCRLRRTCSSLNNFVEENRKKLSSRGVFGKNIRLYAPREGLFGNALPIDSDLEKKLSAVKINKLTLGLDRVDENILKELVKIIKRMNLFCETLDSFGVPLALFLELFEHIEVRSHVHFSSRSEIYNEHLAAFSKSRNRNVITVDLEQLDCSGTELFGMVKHFKGFSATILPRNFQEFTWNLYHDEKSNLDHWDNITFRSSGKASHSLFFENTPPMKVLYEYTYGDEIDVIRLMENQSRYIVFGDYDSYDQSGVTITVAKKNTAALWDAMMKLLGKPNPALRDEFLVADEERQKEILKLVGG